LKILHILYMSLPDCSGSSIRSRGILISQKNMGMEPLAISSPFQKPMCFGRKAEFIDGIEYIRSYNGDSSQEISDNGSSLTKRFRKMLHILPFRKKVYLEAKKRQIDVLHAHSTFFSGFAALYAAKKLHAPFIYEVRSLWENRIADRDKNFSSWLSSRVIRLLETYIMKKADHVIVISKALKMNLLRRGVLGSNISIIENAVDDTILTSGSVFNWPINNQNEFVFAYVGSVTNIEGLELLLAAWNKFCSPRKQCKLKIYGDGVIRSKLVDLVEKNGLKNVKIYGEFSPSDVTSIYSEIDVIVNPRYKTKLSDTVTPLKPLEAMAFRKLVLTSDVGGMRELVLHGQTGYQFKADNATDLLYWLNFIISQDIKKLGKVVEAGQNFVNTERNWNQNAVIYKKLYEALFYN